MKNETPSAGPALPDGIKTSDTVWKYKKGDPVLTTLTLYCVASFGWCITTLEIGKGRGSTGDRAYGVRVSDGGVVRVGRGPHVTKIVEVYVRESRKVALAKYLELHQKGLAEAGQIRDRISSRRAEGALMRAQGRTSWLWSS